MSLNVGFAAARVSITLCVLWACIHWCVFMLGMTQQEVCGTGSLPHQQQFSLSESIDFIVPAASVSVFSLLGMTQQQECGTFPHQ